MALTFGSDRFGPWVTLDCEGAGCEAHVSVRPIEAEDTFLAAVDLAEEAAATAETEGWWLIGRVSCPRHALDGFRAMGLTVEFVGAAPDGLERPVVPAEPRSEAVHPEPAAAAAQRGLTAVH